MRNHTMVQRIAVLVGLVLFAVWLTAAPAMGSGGEEVGQIKVLSLVPNISHGCVAGSLSLAPGEALAGVRWVNNDSASPFVRVLLLEGRPGVPPDLTHTGIVVEGPGGGTASWTEVLLTQPVVSTTKSIYVVLVFPGGETTTDVGAGGGPGIGIRAGENSPPFFISADGSEWVKFDARTQLMLEPVLESSLGKASRPAAVLSDLAGQVNYRGVAGEAALPPRFSGLDSAAPNPFNPATELRYSLAKSCEARLAVYNIRGQLVQTLADGVQPAGRYSVVWRGIDTDGAAVASGVYFARLTTCDGEYTRRVTLLR